MPSTTFLFWNLNGKPLAEVVADLADEHDVDVLMLAECAVSSTMLLQTLNRDQTGFHLSVGLSEAVRIFTRFSSDFLTPCSESARVSIRRLTLPAREELLLAVVHLPSKLHWSNDSQAMECTELARMITAEEDKVGHRRTVLVGDFNMNPFEAGIVGAAGLHSVMSRQVASRHVRTVQDREYRFFYNPMWSHFGDSKRQTAGSYYYDNSEQVNYFWNMFDQVLMRPELAERFDSGDLSIITSVGARSLVLANGRPDGMRYSDHLPLVFRLEF